MGWVVDRLKGALNHWVEGLILAGGIFVALFIWRLLRDHLEDEVTFPTWVIALALGVLVAIVVIQAVRKKSEVALWAGGYAGMADVAAHFEQLQAVTKSYANHLQEVLYSLQRVLSGAIPGVDARDLIEDGILQPARELMIARQADDVRLSVLTPDDDHFVMPFAAGHRLESKRNFRLPIATSFSKQSYETGLIYWSGDLDSDERFIRHPRAAQDRAYSSIISVPIRSGDEVVAVFNAIFVDDNAFDEADLIYVRLIGAVIELIWQLAGL